MDRLSHVFQLNVDECVSVVDQVVHTLLGLLFYFHFKTKIESTIQVWTVSSWTGMATFTHMWF